MEYRLFTIVRYNYSYRGYNIQHVLGLGGIVLFLFQC
jgi:hypothetical protein